MDVTGSQTPWENNDPVSGTGVSVDDALKSDEGARDQRAEGADELCGCGLPKEVCDTLSFVTIDFAGPDFVGVSDSDPFAGLFGSASPGSEPSFEEMASSFQNSFAEAFHEAREEEVRLFRMGVVAAASDAIANLAEAANRLTQMAENGDLED